MGYIAMWCICRAYACHYLLDVRPSKDPSVIMLMTLWDARLVHLLCEAFVVGRATGCLTSIPLRVQLVAGYNSISPAWSWWCSGPWSYVTLGCGDCKIAGGRGECRLGHPGGDPLRVHGRDRHGLLVFPWGDVRFPCGRLLAPSSGTHWHVAWLPPLLWLLRDSPSRTDL